MSAEHDLELADTIIKVAKTLLRSKANYIIFYDVDESYFNFISYCDKKKFPLEKSKPDRIQWYLNEADKLISKHM